MGDECGNGSLLIMVTVSPAMEEWLCDGLAGSDKTWLRHKLLQAVTGMCGPCPKSSVTNCIELHSDGH